MCEDWFNTFQALYIYVKKTCFTIIRKSKRSIRIILNNESSAFPRTGLPFWNLKSSLRAAKDERHLTVVECVHHGLFLRRHRSWLDSRRNSELKNLKMMAGIGFLSTLSSMGCPMSVVRARSCLPERVEPQLLWCRKLPLDFSHRWGFHNFQFGYCTGESSLLFLVGFIAIVKGLYRWPVTLTKSKRSTFAFFNFLTVFFLALWFVNICVFLRG